MPYSDTKSDWNAKRAVHDVAAIKYEIELFLLGGEFELVEDGRTVCGTDPCNALAESSYGKVILSCWAEGWSRSWRVLSCERSVNRLSLGCTKQMGRISCMVELRRGEPEGVEELSRGEFAQYLGRLVESSVPDIVVEWAEAARDDLRHLSGNYVRMVIREGAAGDGTTTAGVGVSPWESQAVIDGVLGAGMVWLSALCRSRQVGGLAIFVPAGRANTISTRLTALKIGTCRVSLYEVDRETNALTRVAPYDQGDLSDNLKRVARRAIWSREGMLPAEVDDMVQSVVRIAPEFIEAAVHGESVVLSIRGLDFARVAIKRRRAYFGVDGAQCLLNQGSESRLVSLVAGIIEERSPHPRNRNSVLYRAQGERWLQSAIRQEVTRIDPGLDPRFVYCQVPAYRGEHRTFIDILTVTRTGRLVVMELKVAEDREFPLQALDYWLRVEWHRQRNDFNRRGYFPGLKIAELPPLLYLVAPLFRFHSTTAVIAGCISERVQVYRIGINEDWRSGPRVLLREQLNRD